MPQQEVLKVAKTGFVGNERARPYIHGITAGPRKSNYEGDATATKDL